MWPVVPGAIYHKQFNERFWVHLVILFIALVGYVFFITAETRTHMNVTSGCFNDQACIDDKLLHTWPWHVPASPPYQLLVTFDTPLPSFGYTTYQADNITFSKISVGTFFIAYLISEFVILAYAREKPE